MSYTPHILIVDDDVSLCNSLKGFLSHRDYEITAVHGGEEAIDLLKKNNFDLILLDMMMPDVSGPEVIDYLDSEQLKTIVIVMTGYPSTDSVVESLRKGVYDYLRKPFDLQELETTIGNALAKKELEDVRKRTEEALQKAHDELERRVEERTAELIKANEQLRREIERGNQAEEELRKAHGELEIRVVERTSELAKANDELRTEIVRRETIEEALRNSSEKLKFFAYSVIHDLRSPAVGIYGLTRLLHKHYKDSLDEKGKNYCDQILKVSEHVAALIEKINTYIAAKEAPINIEEINAKEILQIIRDEFSPQLTIRQIEWFEPETIAVIKADRVSMLRVFRNFVDNALKYGGDDLSTITIGYKESKELQTFSISDNGAGMRSGDYQKVFTAFLRNDTSRSIEGAGLGLAIVREIAERHNGRVWAEPGKSRGTTFFISLPKNPRS